MAINFRKPVVNVLNILMATNVSRNISWLILERFVRMFLSVLVSIWLARYLGPEDFGKISYATAFVALFGAVATLGLPSIVVRDLVKQQHDHGLTLGSSLILQLIASGIAVLAIAIATISTQKDSETIQITLILSASLLLQANSVMKYWFESQVRLARVVWLEGAVFLVFSIARVAFITMNAEVTHFAWLTLAECFVATATLTYFNQRFGFNLAHWKCSIGRCSELMKGAWPLCLSGVSVIIYTRSDQIMIGNMLGERDVGIYSAALRISEVWYVLPSIIAGACFPAIISAKNRCQVDYMGAFERLCVILASIALAIAVVVTVIAADALQIAFGSKYKDAVEVLMIHIWCGVFVFLGVAGGRWYVLENLQMLSLYRTMLGAGINVGLNVIAIPKFGLEGAAYSTLAAQFMSSYVFDAFSRKTHPILIIKTKAILFLPILIIEYARRSRLKLCERQTNRH